MTKEQFHVILCYTVSRHVTERGAKKAMRELQFNSDDIVMVVRMPEGVDGPPSYRQKPAGKKEKRR